MKDEIMVWLGIAAFLALTMSTAMVVAEILTLVFRGGVV